MAAHVLLPLRRYAAGHPHLADWLIVTIGTLAALLLWFGNA